MIPVHALLNRIRWDNEFAKADFQIGYYDRLADAIVVVSFKQVFQEPGDHFSVKVVDDDGGLHTVPLHRIRTVYRNGERIWQRKH
jgi:uncharacterized protein (UPF0248 family)